MHAAQPHSCPLPTRIGSQVFQSFVGPQLTIGLLRVRGVLVVRFNGSAGIASADVLDQAAHALARLDDRLLVLDFSALDFLSSVGVGQLLSLHRIVQSRGGEVRIGGVNPIVAAALASVRLNELLPIYASVLDAVP